MPTETHQLSEKNYVTTDDIKRISAAKEPYIFPAIGIVWCLSGRTDFFGGDVDKLNRPFDPKDDNTRMMRAIEIANEVNAQLAKKSVKNLSDIDRVIPIYYNGRVKHNDALREALNKDLLPYPKELFIIESIFPDNTIGQVQGFEKFLRGRGSEYFTVAVVTSEFHRLRAACTSGNKSLQTLDEFGNTNALASRNFLFYGIDKGFEAPGSEIDLTNEPTAIMNYSSWFKDRPPSIARNPGSNTFLAQSDVFNFIQKKASDCLYASSRFGLFHTNVSTFANKNSHQTIEDKKTIHCANA